MENNSQHSNNREKLNLFDYIIQQIAIAHISCTRYWEVHKMKYNLWGLFFKNAE